MNTMPRTHFLIQTSTWLLMLVAFVATGATAKLALANQSPCLRAGDELWEVSSRCLPDLERCTTLNPVTFRVLNFTGQAWQASSEGALQASFQSNPTMRTIIYAHGNWMTIDNARGRGSFVYNRLSQRAGEPVRFIIYTWPSQRDGGPIRDVYQKADRSNTDTYYFAQFLSRVPEESPLGILGFSFGGRVVVGGLHMVSGGSLDGRTSSVWPAPRKVRVSLVAPAFDRNWLAAGQAYGFAMNNIEALVNIYNSQDPVLRRFHFLDRLSTPIAAGFSGLNDPRATQPLQSDQRIEQFDCGCAVGSSHDEMNYYTHCAFYRRALDNVLGR